VELTYTLTEPGILGVQFVEFRDGSKIRVAVAGRERE